LRRWRYGEGGESRSRYENPQGFTAHVGSTPTARTNLRRLAAFA